eukprot:2123132-Amphidinium_carterae.1
MGKKGKKKGKDPAQLEHERQEELEEQKKKEMQIKANLQLIQKTQKPHKTTTPTLISVGNAQSFTHVFANLPILILV